jgi:hypothetical protein
MKIKFIFSLIVVFLMTTGCSTKKAGPMLFNSESNSSNKTVIIKGSYDLDLDKVSPVHNIAIALKKLALHFKSENVQYFTLNPSLQVPPIITKYEDLSRYCYPESVNEDTNFEEKCKITFDRKRLKNDIIIVASSSEKNFGVGTWSVEQVLNDSKIDAAIKEVKNTVKKDIYFSDVKQDTFENHSFFENHHSLMYIRSNELEKMEANQYVEKF